MRALDVISGGDIGSSPILVNTHISHRFLMPPRFLPPRSSHDPVQAIRKRRKALTERYEVDVYRTDAVVIRKTAPKTPIDLVDKKRGLIGIVPSRESLRRLIFVLNNADEPFVSMITCTHTDHCDRIHSVEEHRKVKANLLNKLRRDNWGKFVWVREFQANRSVHWHIFTTLHVGLPGEVNHELSVELSRWYASAYRKIRAPKRDYLKMIHGDGKGFRCCRVEMLRSDAGGRYAAKEGAKRFQKEPPPRWVEGGGAWWRGTRDILITKLRTEKVMACDLHHNKVKIDDYELEFPAKLQYGFSLRGRDDA